MALTRKMLKAMGIGEEQIDQIIEAHADTVDALKEERDALKGKAQELAGVQKELNDTKKQLDAAGDNDGYKKQYDDLKQEFDEFKQAASVKEAHTAKATAYRKMLQAAGVSEKRIDSVLKVSDIDSVELDAKGEIKGADKLTEAVKTEWADFIVSEGQRGANTSTPPGNTQNKTVFSADDMKKMSAAEINANWENIKQSLKSTN